MKAKQNEGKYFKCTERIGEWIRPKYNDPCKKRAKKAAAKPEPAPMNKALEAMGVLKGLQASPNLSDEEKKLLGEVAKTVEAILPK